MLAVYERLAARLWPVRFQLMGGAIALAALEWAGLGGAARGAWTMGAVVPWLLLGMIGIAVSWGLFLICLWFHPGRGWLRAEPPDEAPRVRGAERLTAALFIAAFILVPTLFAIGALARAAL